MNESRLKEAELMVNPEIAAEFEASEPYKRFMKILVDNEIFKDSPLCIALVTYPPDAKCPPHFHGEAVEIYYVLEGRLTATVQQTPYSIEEGRLIYIPQGKEHHAENREDRTCRFLAIHVPGVDDVAKVKLEWTRVGKRFRKEGKPYA